MTSEKAKAIILDRLIVINSSRASNNQLELDSDRRLENSVGFFFI
ncbi:MAG: hypothetical protein ACI81T_001477 [Bacteroidia bacterium]|jgi:hypothetical protein